MATNNDPCECCKALWIRFSVPAGKDFTTSDDTATVKVDKFWQGMHPNDLTKEVVVCNLPTNASEVYVFEGDEGDIGLAFLGTDSDPECEYQIVQMECP